MAEIDGHPLFKWDQIQLLQAVFSLLDTNKKNYLTEEELCGLTSNSNNVHSLLKYTVFWAPLKKKKWSFFESLLQNDTDATIESRSNSLPVLKRGLSKGPKSSEKHLFSGEQTFKRVSTFAVWETAANQLCQQTNVSLRHIRSHEQHEDVIRSIYGKSGTTSKGTTMNGSTAAIKPIAAVSSAPQLRLPLEREYYLSRKINIGDTVWGLHQHGILWLPAVVRSIKLVNNENTDSNSSKNSDSDSAYGHYVYELWYPLTEVDQQRARALTASKQLLALPSQQDVSKLHPKPFNTDRQACAYAFDMIDNTGAGSVSLFKLVAALLSPEFQQLVNTSLSLKIIFGNDGPTILSKTDSHYYSYTDNEVIPMLLPVFIDTFSIKVEESNSQTVTIGNNMMSLSDYISKSDFLEFCQAVVDVKMYSVVTI